MTKPTFERIPYLVIFNEQAAYKDTYAGIEGVVALKAHLLKPANPSKTVIIFMHPIGGGEYLPLPHALARAGYHVIYCNSRYPGVDYALQMEKVVLDLGACIRDAKERLHYDKVVLAGWSGGGSLSAFYQAEAEQPTVEETPAGEPLQLAAANLIPADGLLMMAAHVSRAVTLTDSLDASLTDEADPEQRDPELDLYNPNNPNLPPYSQTFLERYRAAQVARNRRITAWVKRELARLRAAGRPHEERGFVVHGTMADPRFVDPTVDLNERAPGRCFLGIPSIVNMSPVGLARYCSLRSWLSQWSLDDSRADAVRCLARVKLPVLVVGNGADDICTPSHTHRIFEAVPHPGKRLVEIPGATHYYFGQKAQLAAAVAAVDSWLREQKLCDHI